METLALAVVVGLLASLMSAVGVGFSVYMIFKRKLVETRTVFEEPLKRREILVPGQGVYVVQEKRKCRYHDDESEWLRENDSRRPG